MLNANQIVIVKEAPTRLEGKKIRLNDGQEYRIGASPFRKQIVISNRGSVEGVALASNPIHVRLGLGSDQTVAMVFGQTNFTLITTAEVVLYNQSGANVHVYILETFYLD